MKVFIEGKLVSFGNDVKIIISVGETEDEYELHLTITSEGIVKDLVSDGEVMKTAFDLHENIAETLAES